MTTPGRVWRGQCMTRHDEDKQGMVGQGQGGASADKDMDEAGYGRISKVG